MSILKTARPVAVTLAVLCTLTAALWYLRLVGVDLHHPIFFYLLPIALVAIAFGSLPAMLCAVGAIACSTFLLYEPIYSFRVANPLEWGDLICFAVLALIGIKCSVELSRPGTRISATRSRYGRPWRANASD
jgi:K+-sensing histidine kinase KdpD